MSTIPDKNFARFLSEDLNLNKYVLTESLEPVERTAFNLFKYSNEINKVVICDKVEKKFQDFAANNKPLKSDQKQQALKNLKAMLAKFSGSAQDADSLLCRSKLETIIATIQKREPIKLPETVTATAIAFPEKLRRSSSSYSMASPLSLREENSSSPKKTVQSFIEGKKQPLFSKSVAEGLDLLAKSERENVGRLFPNQREAFPSLSKGSEENVPPIEKQQLRSISSLLEELKIQNFDQASSFQISDDVRTPSPTMSRLELNVKEAELKNQHPLTQRLEAHFPEQKWANQSFNSTVAENEAPRDVSRMRSRREPETPGRNSKSRSPVRDQSVISGRGRREEAPTSPRMQPAERTRRFKLT